MRSRSGGRSTPSAGFAARRLARTARRNTPLSTPWTLRTDAPDRPAADSWASHACTSSKLTFDNVTVPQRGRTCTSTADSYRARVLAFRLILPASHWSTSTPTVTADRAGSM